MKTIDTLIKYDLSNRDRELLNTLWWANGCWWKGWINFSKIIRSNIETFNQFDFEKWMRLWEEIEDHICFDHDIDFSRGWNLYNFYRANFIFWYKLFKLTKFAWYWERLFILLVAFFTLNKYGKWYFFFWEKISLKYLLNNKNVRSNKR